MTAEQTSTGLRPESYLRLTLRRFGRRPVAVVGLVIVALLILVAAAAPLVAPYDPAAVDYDAVLQGPTVAHPFGTDEIGRDILSRAVFGSRVSLLIVGAALVLALVFGTVLGILSGYIGGWFDAIVMRITDAMLAFPILVLALAIVVALGPSVENAAIAIAIVNVPGFARLARGEVKSLARAEFIDAARASGSGAMTILRSHVLRSISGTMLVYASLRASVAIITESSLSFLGLGAQPPTPTWGGMVATGATYISEAWWASFFPGLMIFLAVFSLNSVGDGLNDALNVRLANLPRRRRPVKLRAPRSSTSTVAVEGNTPAST